MCEEPYTARKSSGSNATYYLHRDHLGSPEMITNASGNSVVKLSFSAYGERRDVDWDGPITNSHLTSAANVTRHGYTDHLHLDSVKLVHMGGRVYDPVIGRFLSRDPYIDGVASSQGANGYAYVWNNPLTRWDPTGYGGTHENFAVWANSGRWERSNSSGLEEVIVTGRQSYWDLSSSELLFSNVFRLGHIGTGGVSGDGVEWGGTGASSSGPEQALEEVVVTGKTSPPPSIDWEMIGWILISFDVLNTPLSPTPDVGVYGAAMIASAKSARAGAKSVQEMNKHLDKLRAARSQVDRLRQQLEGLKGPKAQQPVRDQLQDLLDQIKGHEKEIRQKWPELGNGG